jgi:hypothetical protein
MVTFIFFLCLSHSLCAAQESSVSVKDEIAPLARNFLVDINLGDIEKFSDLARPEDLPHLPKPRDAEAAEKMKLKDLPQLLSVRAEVATETVKLLIFSDPQITADGKAAIVTTTMMPSESRNFVQAKLLYDLYIQEAYKAQLAGRELPSVDSIRQVVNGPVLQMGITVKAKLQLTMTLPQIYFEKTAIGWRIDFQKSFFVKTQ